MSGQISSVISLYKIKENVTFKHTPGSEVIFNPLNAELNPICHLLALLGGATIVVVSKLRVKSN